jgi:hypothetical protein
LVGILVIPMGVGFALLNHDDDDDDEEDDD